MRGLLPHLTPKRPRLLKHDTSERMCGVKDACELARALRLLQHDLNRPEDVLKVDADEDDVADCLR